MIVCVARLCGFDWQEKDVERLSLQIAVAEARASAAEEAAVRDSYRASLTWLGHVTLSRVCAQATAMQRVRGLSGHMIPVLASHKLECERYVLCLLSQLAAVVAELAATRK